MNARPAPDPASRRICGPVDLIQAIPYLLGFHPHRSAVLVGLTDGRLVVTARMDLPDAAAGALGQTVEAICRAGATEVVGVFYDELDTAEGPGAADAADGVAAAPVLAGALETAAAEHDCVVTELLVVAGGRWRSLRCESEECCPRDGQQLPDTPSLFATEAAYEGLVALPDRTALEQLLEPLPSGERATLLPDIEDATNAAVAAVRDGHSDAYQRAVKRAIFAAARDSARARWIGPDRPTAARFGAALAVLAQRDAVWTAIDHGRLDGRPLWRALARVLPSPYDAAPLFLYGWAAWRDGNGAQAGIAAERAVASDPRYSAADLLLAALTQGVDPRRLPRLNLPRPA
jgi:uncharacterized protein DUF4192